MVSPFDWKHQPSRIDMRDLSRAAKSSYQQTSVVNRNRQAGREPNAVHLPGSRLDEPKKFATQMPAMATWRENRRKK